MSKSLENIKGRLLPLLFLVLLHLSFSCGNKGEHQHIEVGPVPTGCKSNVQIVALVYHRFGEHQYPSTNVSKDLFRQQMLYLQKNGFKVLTLGKAVELLQHDGFKHDKVVVLTIDDAYKSFLTVAMPILREFGFKATLFVNTKTVGGGSYLRWEDLKKLVGEGIEIGNHSHSHDYFVNYQSHLQDSVFENDIQKCQQLLTSELGAAPAFFAYPYGEFSDNMLSKVKKLGFKAALAQNSGVISCQSDFFALPRFPMGGRYTTMKSFVEKVNMKALNPTRKIPNINIIKPHNNPPNLKLIIKKGDIDISRIQCFIQGGNQCQVKIEEDSLFTSISIKAKKKLHQRRTLYTITAPSLVGKGWNWYSHLWVNPSVDE